MVMKRGRTRRSCRIPYGGARAIVPLRIRVSDMDMVRPWKDPWGPSPSLRPWEACTVLTDLCGRSPPVGPPRWSCDAYVVRVCYCHCGSDRFSRYPVRLVWANGSFGCRTIAARTPGLLTSYVTSFLRPFTGLTCQFLRNVIDVWGIITVYLGNWSHVEILTPVWA